MPFVKNNKKDEISVMHDEDQHRRKMIEAHAVASKAVSTLMIRTLLSNNIKYRFDGIADKAGFIQIKVPKNDKRETAYYSIHLDIVPKDYQVDLSIFRDSENYSQVLIQLAKMQAYSDTIYGLLKSTVERDYLLVKDWKLTFDKDTSTFYIDPEHSKRIGFVITKLRNPENLTKKN